MKKLLFLLLLLFPLYIFSQDFPKKPNPPRLVNDIANILTPDQLAALERKLVAYDDSTSNQIVVVIVNTIGDIPLEDYTLKILREWGVGNKDRNNGIVILASIQDRKIRIETGYGLEGAVPDITANEIINNHIVPNFRDQNYYRGLDEATDQIIRAAAGEYKAPAGYRKETRTRRSGSGLGFFALLIIMILLFSRRGGGGRGGMMSRGGFNPFLGGLLAGMLSSRGGGWSGGGGGWSGGGGGGGWSGGGGGFGGFGGGSGGGGGASGSW